MMDDGCGNGGRVGVLRLRLLLRLILGDIG
jgi:hypothetical protein